MSKNINPNSPTNPLAPPAAEFLINPDEAEMRRRLLELELADREERQRINLERAAQRQRAREQNARELKKELDKVLHQQATCSHKKQNGNTHVVGQRDHGGNTIFMCQGCQKTWIVAPGIISDFPKELAPEAIKVGGPIVGTAF